MCRCVYLYALVGIGDMVAVLMDGGKDKKERERERERERDSESERETKHPVTRKFSAFVRFETRSK
jgi:hypothetical protein